MKAKCVDYQNRNCSRGVERICKDGTGIVFEKVEKGRRGRSRCGSYNSSKKSGRYKK